MERKQYVVEVDLAQLFNADVRHLLELMPIDDELFFDIVMRYWTEFENEDERKRIETLVWRYVVDMVGDDPDPRCGKPPLKDEAFDDFKRYFSAFIDCLYSVFGKLRPYISPFMQGNTYQSGVEPVFDGIYRGCVVFMFEEYN